MSTKPNPRVTVTTLRKMKREAEKIVMLTAYDASFAKVLDAQGVDVILVGDSLGMVIQGHETTVPVTMDDMVYHTRAVAKNCQHALVIGDLPFMSYTSPEQALRNSARLMQESGAHMVKLEGGAPQVATVAQLAHHGVPVCAHLGLQPQSVHKLGGYRVQGRDEAVAKQMLEDAKALQDAGADMLVLECVPVALAAQITQALEIPTIGIGAGRECDGQVLVLHDMLGISPRAPKFSHDFIGAGATIPQAVASYVQAVKAGNFPEDQHCFF
ncbi:3-methyl-2-oxobutanoate hydroxymethyltransferase [Thiothrix litoralis]|jgi:3-methyl-2-oxobutanoate hydroxymethyltransferase|uniref:3-methyl-2-oxobutanoate hydroxymethyltransferase n=1 Tax=Thiothrix litoralis TaxID=2891210 RepID=A0ABX7WV20_9GAMM|nr:3-methyl-2-oxobutanoate hydroxymethyltransferase [Thiothrix litoralis]QTR47131.1 3-methyl-2-oxobutanoate hydroxymethyltransferase [Thiothrix litoralis]